HGCGRSPGTGSCDAPRPPGARASERSSSGGGVGQERWAPVRGPRSGSVPGPGRSRRWWTEGTGRGGSPYRACMPDPAYTHGYSDAVLGSHRHRTAENSAAHLLPRLRAGMRLLDVGSGAGTITADLARLVGPEHLTALEV